MWLCSARFVAIGVMVARGGLGWGRVSWGGRRVRWGREWAQVGVEWRGADLGRADGVGQGGVRRMRDLTWTMHGQQ